MKKKIKEEVAKQAAKGTAIDQVLIEKDAQIEKLVKDMVDLALTNNQVLAKGNFQFQDLDAIDLAVRMNNEVLRTFTDIENEEV